MRLAYFCPNLKKRIIRTNPEPNNPFNRHDSTLREAWSCQRQRGFFKFLLLYHFTDGLTKNIEGQNRTRQWTFG